MSADYLRRRLLKAGVGAAALGALPGVGVISFATAAGGRAGMATAFRATTHSMAWLGVETGIFKRLGLNATFEKFTPGGPEIPTGLQRGEFEFGQTGVNTRLTVEKAGATAKYVGLGNFQNIYKALAAGDIDAGVMQIHQRFPGQRQYGWNAFDVVSLEIPSAFITTRKLIASDRDMVLKVVQGIVETIHFFKTQRDAAVLLLQRFLQIDDRNAVEDLHAFYVPLFPAVPRVDLGEDGIKLLRDSFSRKFPAAAQLQESDIVDSSFIDQLENSGFIQRLYGNVKL